MSPFSPPKSVFALFAAALPLLATACGHPVQRQLEGRWFGESVENFEQRELSRATGWAKGVSFEFSGTNITVAIPAEEPRTAPYKVAGVHAQNVTLSVQRPDGKLDAMKLRLDDDRNVRWMLDDVHAVVLRRED